MKKLEDLYDILDDNLGSDMYQDNLFSLHYYEHEKIVLKGRYDETQITLNADGTWTSTSDK